jgi:hypothetical protein
MFCLFAEHFIHLFITLSRAVDGEVTGKADGVEGAIFALAMSEAWMETVCHIEVRRHKSLPVGADLFCRLRLA